MHTIGETVLNWQYGGGCFMEYVIEQVNKANFDPWLTMGLKLWPENTYDEAKALFTYLLKKTKEVNVINLSEKS